MRRLVVVTLEGEAAVYGAATIRLMAHPRPQGCYGIEYLNEGEKAGELKDSLTADEMVRLLRRMLSGTQVPVVALVDSFSAPQVLNILELHKIPVG